MSTQENKSELEIIKDTIFLWVRHWYFFVISMAICMAFAFIYLKTKVPVMKVAAQVAIRQDESISGSSSISRNQSLLSAFGVGRGSQNIEDETIKMNSQGYMKKIVRKFSLNFDYTQTEYMGFIKNSLYNQSPVVLSVDEAISDTILPVIFKINLKKEKANITMKQGRKTLGKYEVSTFPSVLNTPMGSFSISKSEFYDLYKKPMNITVFCANYDFMAQIYRASVEVDYEKKTSDLIQLSMDTENPPVAKKILNEMIATYNDEWERDKGLVTDKTSEYINERLQMVRDDLITADKSIQVFKDQNNLTDIEANVKYYFALSGEILPQLMEAETHLKMTDLITDFVTDEKNKYSLFPLVPNLSVPMAEIITKYNEVLITRNEMGKAPSQSALIRPLNSQVEAQREALLTSIDNVKSGLKIVISDLKKKESEIKNKIGKIPEIENIYIKLRREQEIQQTFYIILLEMQVQTEVKGVSLLPKLKVIDEPYTINRPIEPNLMKVAIITLFFGGIVLPFSAIYGFPLIGTYIRKRKEK